jgi:N utilization substance protein B
VTEAPLSEFTADLVMGVVDHWGQVDELISTYSQGWTLSRMPAVDRAILRLGAYEVLFSTDVPEPVAISEWVGLATELSTDDSPRFVNGLLARLAEVKPTLA